MALLPQRITLSVPIQAKEVCRPVSSIGARRVSSMGDFGAWSTIIATSQSCDKLERSPHSDASRILTPSAADLRMCRVGLGCAKVGFVRASELSRFCSGRMVITIQNRDKQSERHSIFSVPKAHNVIAQGNALGKCETNVQSPKGAK